MDDFRDAAKRHLDDAQLLFTHTPQRLANASHLFGLSAECSLKAIAKYLTHTAHFGGRNGHIPGLFSELKNVSPAMAGNAALAEKIVALEPQFAHWNVNQRYTPQDRFTTAKTTQECTGAHDAYRLMTNCLGGLA
ncbi:hypothetical protein [Verminephrobacter eiseniae]|uniref:HEPN domain-containing protein n=1 Tax=Verminephrobacter eiseniae (strain EF01-2) TaxID=391735 RepID=A1WIB4_VEREI|nr:hypothetical protein [Verminephrobacter eiseniae]ABM57371.1 hypothetical protein Veis_1613 [Verminephrobacter eiseniae EF01-2]